MRKSLSFLAFLTGLLFTGCHTAEKITQEPDPIEWPGPRGDGSILLPNLWSLRPAGKQVVLGDFPVNIAVHPSGKWAAVLHSGHGEHEIIAVAIPNGEIISRAPIDESFY